MAKEYLRPEDVQPTHTRQTLDFLNAVRTADELARAVHVPGEPDVGVRLARRVLDRRDELGGFSNLRQLYDVPLIGPERFTEIVVSLSDARVAWIPDRPRPTLAAPHPGPMELLTELQALRARVDALARRPSPPAAAAPGPRHRISLRVLQSLAFLGQPVRIVVTLTAAESPRPRPDAAITLMTTWGRLRGVEGVSARDATCLVVRTDGDGIARAVLLPPTSQPLPPVQQRSLEVALGRLDHGAPTPRAAEAGLRELARLYGLGGAVHLRGAIDAYFRDFGAVAADTADRRDDLAAWPLRESTVLAFVPAPDGGGTDGGQVEVLAAACIRVRDWLPPWLRVFQGLARAESRLGERLVRANDPTEPGALLGRIYTRINDFLAGQRGLVGERVARGVVQASLRELLQTRIGELPVETRLAVPPALDAASRTVAAAGTGGLMGLRDTRVELRRDFETEVIRIETEKIGQLKDRIEMNETEFTKLRLDIEDLLELRSHASLLAELPVMRAEIERLHVRSSNLNETLIQVNTALLQIDDDLRNLRLGG